MESEIYELAESSVGALYENKEFYLATASTVSIAASRYLEDFGFDSDSALED